MTLDNTNPAAEGRRDGQTRTENSASRALSDKLDRLLAKAKPSKRELIQQRFRDLYPRLEVHLSKGVPLKDVLAAFNELTHAKVCARTFNDMLEQERHPGRARQLRARLVFHRHAACPHLDRHAAFDILHFIRGVSHTGLPHCHHGAGEAALASRWPSMANFL